MLWGTGNVIQHTHKATETINFEAGWGVPTPEQINKSKTEVLLNVSRKYVPIGHLQRKPLLPYPIQEMQVDPVQFSGTLCKGRRQDSKHLQS